MNTQLLIFMRNLLSLSFFLSLSFLQSLSIISIVVSLISYKAKQINIICIIVIRPGQLRPIDVNGCLE